jgi:hypothetical protein
MLGRWFSRRGGARSPEDSGAVEYKGYRIRPAPFRSEGQFQTAGVIMKDFGDGLKEHQFIRAERHVSAEDAAAFAITKGKQIIDERGDKLFERPDRPDES